MPSRSKTQRRLMGWAYSIKKKGKKSEEYKKAPDNIKHIVDTMTLKELEDFAGTKEKDLPETKNESIMLFEEFTKNMVKGSRGDDVKELQTALTTLGFSLGRYGVDGILGNETLGQARKAVDTAKKTGFTDYYTNISNVITKDAFNKIKGMSEDDEVKDKFKAYFEEQEEKIMSADVIASDVIQDKIEEPEKFIEKVKEVSAETGIDPNWLIAVMYKESGINPKAVNKTGGASGLIQFMPRTARFLGTTIENIRRMTAVEQLEYVKKYFEMYKGKLKNFPDLYLATFYPYALDKKSDYVIGSEKSDRWVKKIARQNKAIDINSNNKITKKEFYDYVWKGIKTEWKSKLI